MGQQMPMVTQGEGDSIALSPTSKRLANWAAYYSPSQFNPFGPVRCTT
jgi:NTE family protein